MPSPHAVILCKSVHLGNTAKIARMMAAALQAEVVTPEDFPSTSLERVVLLPHRGASTNRRVITPGGGFQIGSTPAGSGAAFT